MNLGLRTILLVVATVLFVLAVFISEQNFDEFLALGLAAFAFAFVTDALGWADRSFNSTTRRDDTT